MSSQSSEPMDDILQDQWVRHRNSREEIVRCSDLVPLRSCFGPLSMSIVRGEWLGLTGPSGVGKSSLLFVLSALQNPASGRAKCLEFDLGMLGPIARCRFRRFYVHLVPQSLQLFSQLTVLENLLLVQRLQGNVSQARCRDLLFRMGLQSKIDSLPSQLSIGEKQRVCIVRGLATDVPLLLFDEPTSNLDSASVSVVIDLLRESKHDGRSLVVVSNDSRLIPFADRVLSLTSVRQPAAALS